MIDSGSLADYLATCNTAEEAFPAFLHSQVPRGLRQRYLRELKTRHRVFRCPESGVQYVLDFAVAKELFANASNAVRYTALLTDVESKEADFVEATVRYLPVFADEQDYSLVRHFAKVLRCATERRIEKLDIGALVSSKLTAALESSVIEVDVLDAVLSANATIALHALGWQEMMCPEELRSLSKQIFAAFRGEVGKVLGAAEIESIHGAFCQLRAPELRHVCFDAEPADAKEAMAMCATIAQWVTGFLTPCVTWVCYVLLRKLDAQIEYRHGNYSAASIGDNLKKSCLRDFIPFQAIHRIIVRDCVIAGIDFQEDDFVCIIPDALGVASDEAVISAVIGAPNRACMGMHVSNKIVDAYEAVFDLSPKLFLGRLLNYDLVSSTSALEFSMLTARAAS